MVLAYVFNFCSISIFLNFLVNFKMHYYFLPTKLDKSSSNCTFLYIRNTFKRVFLASIDVLEQPNSDSCILTWARVSSRELAWVSSRFERVDLCPIISSTSVLTWAHVSTCETHVILTWAHVSPNVRRHTLISGWGLYCSSVKILIKVCGGDKHFESSFSKWLIIFPLSISLSNS